MAIRTVRGTQDSALASLPRRIHVQGSGSAWLVAIDGEEQAIFSGDGARARAIEAALRQAEELRQSSTVLVVIDTPDDRTPPSRFVRGRLAS